MSVKSTQDSGIQRKQSTLDVLVEAIMEIQIHEKIKFIYVASRNSRDLN
jgi:hypothetical protein